MDWSDGWSGVGILSLSSVVLYRTATYSILDYGAKENSLSTAAIQNVVDLCHEKGGGMVIIPSGRFIIDYEKKNTDQIIKKLYGILDWYGSS